MVRPHAQYVEARDALDGGFSKGWGMHFVPCEEHWADVHVHLNDVGTSEELHETVNNWFDTLAAYRLGQIILISPNIKLFSVLYEFTKNDDRVEWMYWPDIFDENPGRIAELAVKYGTAGFMLSNEKIMTGEIIPGIYKTAPYRHIFALAEEAGLPILWNVTQRKSYSPYHGGVFNKHWSVGEPKGVTANNESLLDDFLEIAKQYKNLKLIGANQLYLSNERLGRLFEEYENLHIDGSVGFFLRWADCLIDEDRITLNKFFTKYADRILFGTGANLCKCAADEYMLQSFLCHARFMLQLYLDTSTLNRIAWANAKDLYNLKTITPVKKGSVRP